MRKLLIYLEPYRPTIGLVVLLLFLQALCQLYLPTLMADIVDIGIAQGDIAFIIRVGAVMLLVALIGAAFTVAGGYYSAKVAMGLGKDLRSAVFTRIEGFSLQEFNRFGTSSLITRTTNDITQIQQVVLMLLRMMVLAPVMAVGGIVMAVSKNAELSLIMVVVIPILGLGVWVISRKVIPLLRLVQERVDKLTLVLRERLTGVRVIRAFNRDAHEQQRFTAANRDLTTMAITVNRIMAGMMPLMMLVMNLTTIAIVWFGGFKIEAGRMQVGDLMAFIQYGMNIMFSFVMASMILAMLPRASASLSRVAEVLDVTPLIVDPPVAKSGDQRGVVEFREVTFSYPGAEKPTLCRISFTARPGEMTAIIGGTGSGKSALVSLIPRFYDVDQGAVLVGGVDVREWNQADLRARIGFVPQNPVLFSGTIADNIRVGKEDASEAEIQRAAEIAQAAEFIAELKDGYAATVAQGGTNLSGGQKQRLAIARVILRRPEIYVFDDSFSALDYKTDAKLRLALKEATKDATVIIVAQRVSTVMNADQIIVLDEGRIAGIGTHAELYRTCQVYREIVASQLSEEELA